MKVNGKIEIEIDEIDQFQIVRAWLEKKQLWKPQYWISNMGDLMEEVTDAHGKSYEVCIRKATESDKIYQSLYLNK